MSSKYIQPQAPIIVWFRRDLRTADHPALSAAEKTGCPVIPLYIWSPDEEGSSAPGEASRWWLHHSLADLEKSLSKINLRLVLRSGEALSVLREVIAVSGARAVFWNRRYEPHSVVRDKNIKGALRLDGIESESFNGSLLFEPWQILNAKGGPFKVFSSYWTAALAAAEPQAPLPPPHHFPDTGKVSSLSISDFGLLLDNCFAGKIESIWKPGEKNAADALRRFIDECLPDYESERDRPDLDKTSRLSPYLSFGELSPRMVQSAVLAGSSTSLCPGASSQKALKKSRSTFLKEIGWREFSYNLLYHFPESIKKPLRPEFDAFPFESDPRLFAAWTSGNTGYPLVDAGMRQLRATGWMHNRVRMVAASFLVKDLLIPWQDGAAWFWENLIDADMANNTFGWQWTAGCGADAAPFIRIFNPVTQSEKFDPSGDFIRAWVPELGRLEGRWIHKPWEAPSSVLNDAHVVLGETYPLPLVDHNMARQRALHAFRSLSITV